MNTRVKQVLVEGVGPQVEAWRTFLQEMGCQVVHAHEASQGEIQLALEVTNGNLEVKKERVQILEASLGEEIPLLVSTLSASATEVASWTLHPQRVCGFGTFLPLGERNLIEVAPALQTSATVVNQVHDFFAQLGKETEQVVDEAGLVFPRILSLIINEAAFALMEGVAEARDLDLAMKLGTNYPWGPLEWADRIGLDEVYGVMCGLQRDFPEERYRPAPLLRKLVLAGWTGVNVGRGFYTYEEKKEGLYAAHSG